MYDNQVRTCRKCGMAKPRIEFHAYGYICRTCILEYARSYNAFHPHKYKYTPKPENKSCSYYLGCVIAEKIVELIFKHVKHPQVRCRYDFECTNGYKIDVKSACLDKRNKWQFGINKNNVADYFMLIAFNSRQDLNPVHLWLIKGDEYIREQRLNTYVRLDVTKANVSKFEKYERKDELAQAVEICESNKKI